MDNKHIKIDEEKAKEMFDVIRRTEVKNVKTQKHDDKKMATALAKHIYEKVGGKWS